MKGKEHYVTLLDHRFLPMGLSLYESLLSHSEPFMLWVVCVTKEAKSYLDGLNLESIKTILLEDEETNELLAVKPTRSAGEYCWTVTPFVFDFVFKQDTDIDRVTYLDADLFFFKSPSSIFNELESAKKDILITRHSFDERYDQSENCGEFCVQFVTVSRTDKALKVIKTWQEQCIEWCYDIIEPGRFGDQKYLDEWPSLYRDTVHVLKDDSLALGPWNAAKFDKLEKDNLEPVFYHFHGVRFASKHWVVLCKEYEITSNIRLMYNVYAASLRSSLCLLKKKGYQVHITRFTQRAFPMIKFYRKLIKKKIVAARI